MKRVVVTGLGIVSSIGNNQSEVIDSLKFLKSGLSFSQEFKDADMSSHVWGKVDIDLKNHLNKRTMRFMGKQAMYSYIAMKEAIEDAGLTENEISNPRTGIICGSGDASSANKIEAYEKMKKSGINRVKPFYVPRTMGSTCSSNLAVEFKIKGLNYSISSACASSAHCIGNAYEQILFGRQDIIFAGGGEEAHWTSAALFDIMQALSVDFNDQPEKASRPFDKDRDGFVISEGAGILVLEELEHAIKRKAKIYGEIVGYGATSDGETMFSPTGEGAERCMKMALEQADCNIDYINAHGTSTPVGDVKEIDAIESIFPIETPYISSTKSITGHSIGAAGAQESIYGLLMMHNGFICGNKNLDDVDENIKNKKVLKNNININFSSFMTNSFGFGGTNVSLVFKKI